MYIIRNPYMLTYINYQPTYKGINLVEFGEENNERPFLDTPIHRENYIVHFVLEGNGFFCSNSKKYSLSKGKAFVISPQDLVDYGAEKDTQWKYCWVAFSGTDCSVLFEQCGLKGVTVFDYSDKDIQPLTELLSYARDAADENSPAFSFRAMASCFSLLGNLAAKFNVSNSKNLAFFSSIIDRSIKYMQLNLSRPITISSLCDELYVSRSYFSTLFESVMKQPPYRYLQNLRLQRAAELLLQNPNLRVYEIAEMAGFSSTTQFCKTFQKKCDCSPTEFRSRYRTIKQFNKETDKNFFTLHDDD